MEKSNSAIKPLEQLWQWRSVRALPGCSTGQYPSAIIYDGGRVSSRILPSLFKASDRISTTALPLEAGRSAM